MSRVGAWVDRVGEWAGWVELDGVRHRCNS